MGLDKDDHDEDDDDGSVSFPTDVMITIFRTDPSTCYSPRIMQSN